MPKTGVKSTDSSDFHNESVGLERDRLLLNLLRTPPQPRPKRERSKRKSISISDETANEGKRGKSV
jgi:hypothetical protein